MQLSSVAWWGYGIAIAVLVFLLGGMIVVIRAMWGDSDKYSEVKQLMDSLFNTPTFLQHGQGSAERPNAPETAAAHSEHEPFEEECPGCGEKVSHAHHTCPSCGLRLID